MNNDRNVRNGDDLTAFEIGAVMESMESRLFLSADVMVADSEVDANRHVRHRMFAIVDRTNLSAKPLLGG